MVADALEGLGDEDQLDVGGGHLGGVAGLAEEFLIVLAVQGVDLGVAGQHQASLGEVALDEAVDGQAQDFAGDDAFGRDMEEVLERTALGDDHGSLGDDGGLVGDTLEVMTDIAGGEQETDVAAHRAEERQVAHDFTVDALLELIDAVIHAADLEGQGVVAVLDGAEHEAGHVERTLAHQDQVVPELAEFVVEEALHGLWVLKISRIGPRCRPRSGPEKGS